ncbi:MAG: peptidylprolyl isomerase [Bacteroidia bacterium]|nr:peptidylprolyl isomerase [Bacteroidia bacterium]
MTKSTIKSIFIAGLITVSSFGTINASSNGEDPLWKSKDGIYAEFFTTRGLIVCKLEYTKAPLTVSSFVGLAEGTIPNTFRTGKPYFDNLTFHRVVPGFVIQGGDPEGNGMGGPGYDFATETSPELGHNSKGILAMANSGPNTNGSQFYITLNPSPHLDGGYNVFGSTVSGLELLDQIQQGDKIDSVRIIRNGESAKKFDAAKVFTSSQENNKKSVAEKMAAQEKVEKEKQAEKLKLQANLKTDWEKKIKKDYPKAIKTASGLYYIVEKKGTGAKAEKGKTVSVHYTGKFWDGKVFDSSVDRGTPIEFKLGVGQVIEGWDEGIALMNVGTKLKLLIPSYLAYGENGGGPIEPNTDLIFETELMSVK